MVLLGFDLVVLSGVLLMAAILAWGRWRGDFGRRHTYVFGGMFLAFVPAFGGEVATSAGATGETVWLARALLATVGVAGLGLALYGLRLDEAESHTAGSNPADPCPEN